MFPSLPRPDALRRALPISAQSAMDGGGGARPVAALEPLSSALNGAIAH